MTEDRLLNVNIVNHHLLPNPRQVRALLPASAESLHAVLKGRRAIQDILDGKDRRLLLVVGPCSIHDPKAALEYAGRLKQLSAAVHEIFLLVMRVYFEKPRTTVGWKGLINDPDLDDSFRIGKGLCQARNLLLQITNLGLPTATEALDPVTPQYFSELISWYAIGARTTESQTHREMASGLSAPVGFKNGTDGNIRVAINAMKAARSAHHFLGMDQEGRISVFETSGNPYGHIVLRGGLRPNYDPDSVLACAQALEQAGLPKRIVIDCSHANSGKDHKRQPPVFEECLRQVEEGGRGIIGMMLESNIYEGNQPIPPGLRSLNQLEYGVSVTDKCIDWETTQRVILNAHDRLSQRRALAPCL